MQFHKQLMYKVLTYHYFCALFRVAECTLAGMLQMICCRTLPFWWDDAHDFSVLQKLAVLAFNKVIFLDTALNDLNYFALMFFFILSHV